MNALVALAWSNHIHHGRARAWFVEVHPAGWATCSVTEAGFVRVSSNVRVIPHARSPAQAMHLLGRMRALPDHEFWSDDVSPLDDEAEPFGRTVGYRQITDTHLLTLAMRRSGRLATFDRGVEELVDDPRNVACMEDRQPIRPSSLSAVGNTLEKASPREDHHAHRKLCPHPRGVRRP